MPGVLDRFQIASAAVDGNMAEMVTTDMDGDRWSVVEVLPPYDGSDIDPTLPRFVHEVMELQTRWFGLVNASPTTVFEIRRDDTGQIRLQYACKTRRVLRKIRLHLDSEVPGIGFADGVSGVPVESGDIVGGGLLSLGRPDMFPLETEFKRPPTDNVVAALHRDAFPRENVVIQIMFRPAAGRPIRNWLWKRRAFKRVGWLKKEKYAVIPWQQRPATKIEKRQADSVEAKARNPQFHVGIRILFIGTQKELVRSRVKEVASAFNVYESRDTNQYLDAHTVTVWNEEHVREFVRAVAYRWFDRFLFRFRLGIPEVAGLVAVPTIDQSNVAEAEP